MTDTEGYFAVLRPRRLEWQGFFLPSPPDPAITAEAARMRRNIEAVVAATGGAEVRKHAAGRSPETEGRVGIACAALMECFIQRQVGLIASVATVLRGLTGHGFFVLRGDLDPERGGWNTVIEPMEGVATVTEAQAFVRRHALVRLIEFQRALDGLKPGESPKG